MTLQEIIVNNWEILSVAFNAILGYVLLRQQNSLTKTKIRLTETETKADTIKAESAQDMAIIRLLEGQIANGARMAAAIEESNSIARTESLRHAEDRKQFAALVDGSLAQSARVIELVNNFQNFSATQHNQTRDTVNAVGGKVDEMAAHMQQAVKDAGEFRKGMNGRFNSLDEQLRERFESLEHNMQEALKKARDTKPLDASKLDHAGDAGDGSEAA